MFQLNNKKRFKVAQCTLWIQSLAFLTFDVIHFWCDTRQASVAELNSWSDGGSVKRGKGSEKNKIFAFDHFIKHCIPVGWWPEQEFSYELPTSGPLFIFLTFHFWNYFSYSKWIIIHHQKRKWLENHLESFKSINPH